MASLKLIKQRGLKSTCRNEKKPTAKNIPLEEISFTTDDI